MTLPVRELPIQTGDAETMAFTTVESSCLAGPKLSIRLRFISWKLKAPDRYIQSSNSPDDQRKLAKLSIYVTESIMSSSFPRG